MIFEFFITTLLLPPHTTGYRVSTSAGLPSIYESIISNFDFLELIPLVVWQIILLLTILVSESLETILNKLLLFLIFNIPLFPTDITFDSPSNVSVILSISNCPPLFQIKTYLLSFTFAPIIESTNFNLPPFCTITAPSILLEYRHMFSITTSAFFAITIFP